MLLHTVLSSCYSVSNVKLTGLIELKTTFNCLTENILNRTFYGVVS